MVGKYLQSDILPSFFHGGFRNDEVDVVLHEDGTCDIVPREKNNSINLES